MDTLNVYWTAYSMQFASWFGGARDNLFGFIGAHPWASFEAGVAVSIFLLTSNGMARRNH